MKETELKPFVEDAIYPLTIVADRYTGTYSGAQYTAWNLYPCNVPFEIDDDDVSCVEFWECGGSEEYIIGKGRTVSEALLDLYVKLKGADNEQKDI